MKYLSLFTGIGGFELGIENAFKNNQSKTERLQAEEDSSSNNQESLQGASCIGYSEIDKYALQIFRKHYPKLKNYGDTTKIDTGQLPDFDLLVGGFPCQAFSIAGKRGGFDDTRGTLFFEIARILRDKQPKHFLLENVKGLLHHDEGSTFHTIIGVLADLGYRVEWQVLNSKHFGVPQNRQRVFIVGHLRGECRRKVFPIEKANRKDNETRQIWRCDNETTADFRDAYRHERLLFNRIRRLTPTECERLQGFPPSWTEKGIDKEGNEVEISDTQRYKTLGNAVTTNVISAIIENFDCLD